ncbi:glycoside hydrolase superfamily [Aspergillus granulosus]|uniref:Beta-mannosidase B n=1 Tax=Aspergillus granulosus TaxID=176169 RepID=A0ABR4H2D0_9EURO
MGNIIQQVVVPPPAPVSKETLLLNEGWQYKASDTETWSNAQPLPTTVHLDLLADGGIPDPFYGKNESLVQWVAAKTWIYKKEFRVPAELLHDCGQKIVLVFEGLDTYATVTLDGETILETSNMFLGHRVDITPLVTGSEDRAHTLEVIFHNAEEKAEEEIRAHPEHSWFSFHFGQKRLAARKAQYHFGWDWGPVLKDCGPWKPIYLEIYQARIADLSIGTRLTPDHKEATLDIALDIDGNAKYVRIDIERDDTVVESRLLDLSRDLKSASIRVPNPSLWWPYTLGNQALYTARATLLGGRDNGVKLDTKEKRFGIRKIELVQQPLHGQDGTSFYFRVNDIPIFATGSCWIPLDSFVTRGTPEKYRRWVQLAKDTNQIMLRVWGGGIYEYDAFFDACDELGLLVWHDLMFACGIYPAYSAFEESVTAEARQNLVRLRHHPSMALWCGNNEDYAIAYIAQMLRGVAKYDPSEKDVEKIKKSGLPARLFYELRLPELCKELVPDVPYWPGSPYGGSFCNDTTVGDIHQWHVWHLDKKPYQDYPRLSGRMVTEFGLQAIPHFRTVKQYYYPADKCPSLDDGRDYTTDDFMTYHNKSEKGPADIEKYCTDNIPFDKGLRGYIYCSQLIQSEGLGTALRGWRRLWQGSGRRYCGGALVWQLNDCYPVSSWAIADCELRPKMAYWAVKRENQPVTVGLERTSKENDSLELEAWVCNMTLHPIPVNYRVRAWNVRTGQTVWTHSVLATVNLAANRSTELWKVQLNPSLGVESKWTELVFSIHLFSVVEETPTSETSEDGRMLARHVNFHQPLKEVPFGTQEDRVTVKLVKEKGRSLLELRSLVPTKGVYCDFEDDSSTVEWEDNCVDIVPGEASKLYMTGFQHGPGQSLAMEQADEIIGTEIIRPVVGQIKRKRNMLLLA